MGSIVLSVLAVLVVELVPMSVSFLWYWESDSEAARNAHLKALCLEIEAKDEREAREREKKNAERLTWEVEQGIVRLCDDGSYIDRLNALMANIGHVSGYDHRYAFDLLIDYGCAFQGFVRDDAVFIGTNGTKVFVHPTGWIVVPPDGEPSGEEGRWDLLSERVAAANPDGRTWSEGAVHYLPGTYKEDPDNPLPCDGSWHWCGQYLVCKYLDGSVDETLT